MYCTEPRKGNALCIYEGVLCAHVKLLSAHSEALKRFDVRLKFEHVEHVNMLCSTKKRGFGSVIFSRTISAYTTIIDAANP